MSAVIAHLLMLGLFLLAAKAIGLLAKRPVNGAFGYLIAAGVIAAMNLLQTFNTDIVPANERAYVLGYIVATLSLPIGLAIYLSLRHGRSRRATVASEPVIIDTAVLLPQASPPPCPREPEPLPVKPVKAPFHLPVLVLISQMKKFWNGQKSLAAAFWGIGIAGTASLLMLLAVALEQGAEHFIIIIFILIVAHLVFALKAIWACAPNGKSKVMSDLARVLIIILLVFIGLGALGLR